MIKQAFLKWNAFFVCLKKNSSEIRSLHTVMKIHKIDKINLGERAGL